MSTWRIVGGHDAEPDLPVPFRIEIAFHISDEAPPALVAAVGGAIAEALNSMNLTDEQREQVVREMQERAERMQRQADNAARLLIGDDEPTEGDPNP